jgi:molybdopterin-guanine dinucleotide biosynthesis protein B
VGKSGVGKTTLIEKLILEFIKRGYRVAAVKHVLHDFEVDYAGKDTWRYAKVGACSVIISSEHKMALIKHLDEEISLDKLGDLYLEDVDIIIVEGYKKEKIPKIEVFRKACQEALLCRKDEFLLAVASDVTLDLDLPILDINNADAISEFIIQEIIQKRCKTSSIILKVNDQKIPLNRFVKEMFKQVFTAMISTLKLQRIDIPKKLEVMIDLEKTTSSKDDYTRDTLK